MYLANYYDKSITVDLLEQLAENEGWCTWLRHDFDNIISHIKNPMIVKEYNCIDNLVYGF